MISNEKLLEIKKLAENVNLQEWTSTIIAITNGKFISAANPIHVREVLPR